MSGHDPLDDSKFYQHWQGKRTKMADVITATEVGMLEDVVAPLQEEYYGPALGTRHEYPVARVKKVSGSEPPDWLVEQRRLERAAWLLQREADHARARALDQAARELTRYRQNGGAYETTVLPRRRARYGIAIHCPCGHRGYVMLGDRPGPWRLRCSECDELQEF